MLKSSIRYKVDTAVFKAWQEGAEIFLSKLIFSGNEGPPPGSEIFLNDPVFNDSIVFTGAIL